MRTAREVLQESIGDLSDAALADLRAEGMVIVTAADVAMADSFVKSMCASFTARGHDMADYYLLADRLDAALAAGGTDGQS